MYILAQYPRKGKAMEEKGIIAMLSLIGITALIAAVYMFTHSTYDELPELHAEPIKEQLKEEIKEINVPKEASPVMHVSDEELIAQVVMAEAGNQEMVGKVAVAMVVLNRCDEWGMTVESVVSQEGRFAYPYYGTVTDDCYAAVRIAQENRELFPSDMLYFRNTKFHDFGEPYLQIQGHFFSRKGE